MKMLKNTKRELKEDLNVKALSLVIDRYVFLTLGETDAMSGYRQKCMAIRLNFPYHTRCVCTSLKEDEAQDLALLGTDGDSDDAPAVRIQKKRGNRRPRVKQTYYMKF